MKTSDKFVKTNAETMSKIALRKKSKLSGFKLKNLI